MPNTIALFRNYVPYLDEAYKLASLTAVLDGPAELVREGASANELIIPKLDMQGLANYGRNTGYVDGDVTLTHQTVTMDYDRGRMFQVDALDNAETAGIAFGRLAGEFIRVKVGPEIDAYRLAKYAGASGIGTATGALADGAAVVAALRVAANAMDEAEAPESERYLFITPSLYGMVEDMDTIKSRAVLARFGSIIRVPQTRMYSAVDLAASAAGGYSKGGSAKNLNFIAIHKPAVVQFQKHIAPKVITPEANQNADAWKFGYRVAGYAQVLDNKVGGIYAHTSAT